MIGVANELPGDDKGSNLWRAGRESNPQPSDP